MPILQSRDHRERLLWLLSIIFLLISPATAQVHYAAGQNVAPEFEGWEHNPDGTYSMVFGYLNRNYEEELDIPVGTGNNVALGGSAGGDRGQPEHFYPDGSVFFSKWLCRRIGIKRRRWYGR